jgi:hypothetical protein
MASFYGKTPEFDAAMTATIEIFRQLCELEERAGIEVQTMDALRLMGDDTAGENIREKKLQAIRAMRTIYLGVPDVGLRKELIRTRREMDKANRAVQSLAEKLDDTREKDPTIGADWFNENEEVTGERDGSFDQDIQCREK